MSIGEAYQQHGETDRRQHPKKIFGTHHGDVLLQAPASRCSASGSAGGWSARKKPPRRIPKGHRRRSVHRSPRRSRYAASARYRPSPHRAPLRRRVHRPHAHHQCQATHGRPDRAQSVRIRSPGSRLAPALRVLTSCVVALHDPRSEIPGIQFEGASCASHLTLWQKPGQLRQTHVLRNDQSVTPLDCRPVPRCGTRVDDDWDSESAAAETRCNLVSDTLQHDRRKLGRLHPVTPPLGSARVPAPRVTVVVTLR